MAGSRRRTPAERSVPHPRRSTRMRLPRARLLLGVAAALAAATPASAAPTAPDVPARNAAPEGHKPFLLAHATAVQSYPCTSVPGGYAWGPRHHAPPMTATSEDVIGDHFGGPSWRSKDGSTVTAARVDGVTVDPTAIPWLLIGRTPAGI